MVKIELRGKNGKGIYTILDKEDFDKFGCKLYISAKGYVLVGVYQSEIKKLKPFLLHRLITNCPKGMTVDHINGDKLDNRKENLRICSIADNNRNKSKASRGEGKYKGAFFQKKNKNYRASIAVNGKFIHLGCFPTEEEAAMAYNEAAYVYFGEFAKLNKVIL